MSAHVSPQATEIKAVCSVGTATVPACSGLPYPLPDCSRFVQDMFCRAVRGCNCKQPVLYKIIDTMAAYTSHIYVHISQEWWNYELLQTFNEHDWMQNFRMKQETFLYICNQLRATLQHDNTVM